MSKPKSPLHSRSRSYSRRRVNQYPIRQRFLIVCEGEKTEPNYFRKFRAPGLIVEVKGTGCNTVSVVREAIQLSQEEPYDQVWCVFDRDSFPVELFNHALKLAKQNHIQVAYSNQAFELWYLLHFHYYNTAITRQDYIERLEQCLHHRYAKNDGAIYDELYLMQTIAIKNAQRLLSQYDPRQPCVDDPSTTVHMLVEQLLMFAGPIVR